MSSATVRIDGAPVSAAFSIITIVPRSPTTPDSSGRIIGQYALDDHVARLIVCFARSDAEWAERVVAWASAHGYETERLIGEAAAGAPELRSRLATSDALVAIMTPAWMASPACRAAFQEANLLRRPVFPVMVSGSGDLVVASGPSRFALSDNEATGLKRLAVEIDASVKAALSTRAAYRFCAFISYSHADKAEARRLHRAIEAFRMPKPLVGKLTAFARVGRKVGKAFRDDEELKGSADLGALIQGALDESETLVVICSPRSARSAYVNEEIASFKRLGREARVIPIIIDGEPHHPERECFPAALTRKAGPDGLLTDVAAEPLAINLREHGRRRTVLKVIAGITGLEFDELERRDRRRRTRQRQVFGAFAAAALIALTTGLAVVDRNVGQQAIVDRAAKVLPERRPLLAAQLALASLPRASDLGTGSGAATATLLASGYAFPTRVLDPQMKYSRAVLTSDGVRVIARTHAGSIEIWDIRRMERLGTIAFTYYGGPSRFENFELSSDETRLITYNRSGPPHLWNALDGGLIAELGESDVSGFPKFSGDGKRVAVAYREEIATIYDAERGDPLSGVGMASNLAVSHDASRVVTEIGARKATALWDGHKGVEIVKFPGTSLFDVKLSPDGARLVVDRGADATLWNAANGKQFAMLRGGSHVYQCELSPDGTRVVTLGTDGEAILWDTADGRRIATIGPQGSETPAFSPSGHVVVVSTGGRARVSDARTGALLSDIGEPGEGAGGLLFVPGRPRVAMMTKAIGLTLRDTQSGALIARLTDDNEGYDPKISKDGRIIQAKDTNHWVKLWDTQTGTMIGALSAPREGHRWVLDDASVNAITVSIDGVVRLKRLYADATPGPAALRARVCVDNRDIIGTFPPEERTPETPSGRALLGRPWHPCDWQGLRTWEGWRQLFTYGGTRAGLPWDYEPPSISAKPNRSMKR